MDGTDYVYGALVVIFSNNSRWRSRARNLFLVNVQGRVCARIDHEVPNTAVASTVNLESVWL